MCLNICELGENQKFFTRELPIAGHHITKAIMKSQNLNYEEAEKLKFMG